MNTTELKSIWLNANCIDDLDEWLYWVRDTILSQKFIVNIYGSFSAQPEGRAFMLSELQRVGVPKSTFNKFVNVPSLQEIAFEIIQPITLVANVVTQTLPTVDALLKHNPLKSKADEIAIKASQAENFEDVADPQETYTEEHICFGCSHSAVCAVASAVSKSQFENQFVTIRRCAAFAPEYD